MEKRLYKSKQIQVQSYLNYLSDVLSKFFALWQGCNCI